MTTAPLRIALVGDRDDTVTAHRAIPLALDAAARMLGLDAAAEWVPTEEITSAARLARFDGLWCTPRTPYRSLDGALAAITHARTSGLPYLGTCGGFQYAIVEYARHVLGWVDAVHAEDDPGAARTVIAPLACALVEVQASVDLAPGSRVAAAYGELMATASYRCRYGVDESLRSALVGGPLRVTAEDAHGDVRAVELEGHPFFVATLWQPERDALAGRRVPLAEALLQAARSSASNTR
jgi:CTP synthase (UTP-ammonia lyase)